MCRGDLQQQEKIQNLKDNLELLLPENSDFAILNDRLMLLYVNL